MRTGVIASTNPGEIAADGYLAHALQNYPSCAGFVVYDGTKMHISKIRNPDLETLKKVFLGLKDSRINMHLGNYPDGFLEDDIQPFVLVEDEKKNAVVAVMLDGDWVNTAAVGSNHSDEFFVALNQLRPMLAQLFRLTKGDVNAMIEEIDGDATKQAILNTFINRGSVHFMFNNGQVRSIIKNDLEMEYPWGWVSNHVLYTEAPAPTAAEANPLNDLLSGKALKTLAPTLTVEPKKEEVELPALVLPPAPELPKVHEVGRKITCPREIKKPNKVEAWYRKNANWCPNNYMSYPEVEVKPKPTSVPVSVKDPKDLKTLAVGKTDTRVILPDVASKPADIATRTPPKINIKPNVLPSVKPLEPEIKKDVIPSMSPETQKKLVDSWLKETETMVTTTDRSGNEIIDPKEAVALETKYADFASRIGMKFEDIFSWRVDRLEKLMYDHPDAMLHLVCDLRQRLASKMMSASGTSTTEVKKTLVLPQLKKTG